MKLENLNRDDQDYLESLLNQPIKTIEAKTFLSGWRTSAFPVLLQCEDKKKYVVKGKQAGRQIINDQIVARLGLAIKAPVGTPQIIEVSKELIEIEPQLEDFIAGTAHGTEYIVNCTDLYELPAADKLSKENRIRLSTLALLFGWTHASDQQFIYENNPPNKIYSVDHGNFFPNPPEWSVSDLVADNAAILDPYFDGCNFIPEELRRIYDILKNVTKKIIIEAVAFPREEWEITFEERLEMISYLTRRTKELQTHLESQL